MCYHCYHFSFKISINRKIQRWWQHILSPHALPAPSLYETSRTPNEKIRIKSSNITFCYPI